MNYQSELDFLCETLLKSRVRAAVLELYGTDTQTDEIFKMPRIEATPEIRTIYRLKDEFDLCYIYFLLPETQVPKILFIGPFLGAPITPERLQVLGNKRGVPPLRRAYFEEFYTALPVLENGCQLYTVITTFCERIWKSPGFAIIDLSENQHSVSPINEQMDTDEFDGILINMKAMENRYKFENELMQAVSLGQLHKEDQLLSAFSDQAFEQRLPDSLRNAKNYCVIMNTLLRKAAENGGVHPLYLDRVSSEFAHKIEYMPDISENSALMCEMFRSYCRLVQKHALTHYSLVVQKTILLIDSDLSANLSLKTLARAQNVSAGYLSAIFKKDTGKTLTQYIREKRIKHAKYLLSTTKLQIQTVAMQCGIVDMQYFSKTFKKLVGKTPTEYREQKNGM